MRIVILGFGYCAAHFLAVSGAQFTAIAATTRDAAKAQHLTAHNITLLDIADGISPTVIHHIGQADALLVSAPPGETGDPFVNAVAQALRPDVQPPQIVYLSTIGVYGDHAGRWVDETTPAMPHSQRSRQRLAAEAGWQALGARTGTPVAILRLPGIYGPGRNALVQVRAGTARRIVKPGQVFNRVHVTDIAHAIAAVLRQRAAGIWNITDDEPCPPQDVITFAASLLNMTPPPLIDFDQADLSPMGRSFYGENKRVSNARAKADLAWHLRYPTYRDGLRALIAEQPGA